MITEKQIEDFIKSNFSRFRIITPDHNGEYNQKKIDLANHMSGGRTITLQALKDKIVEEFFDELVSPVRVSIEIEFGVIKVKVEQS